MIGPSVIKELIIICHKRVNCQLFNMTFFSFQALEMFSDLRQFEHAKDFLGSSDQRNIKQLIKKQAEWCKTTNDPKAAA